MSRRHLQAVVGAGTAVGTLLLTAPPASAYPGEGLVRGAIGSAWDRVVDALTAWVLDGVAFLAHGVLAFLGPSSTPKVTAMWFSGPGSPFESVRGIAAVLMVACALLAVVQGAMRGDIGGMLTRVLGGIPLAVLATVAVTVVTDKLLGLTDAFAAGILDPTGADAARFLSGLTVASSVTGNGFAVVLVALIAAFGALALWVELLVRAALVYILVALAPLAFAAAIWPAARGTARRLVELLLAVVVSKLVVSIALAIGIAAVGGVGIDTGGGVVDGVANAAGQLLVGGVILGLAAFAPFLTLRLFPVAEAAGVAHGVSRAPVRTAISALYLANSATRLASGPLVTPAMSGDVMPAAQTATRAATAGFDLGRASVAQPSQEAPS
jgi:hypothetical protein